MIGIGPHVSGYPHHAAPLQLHTALTCILGERKGEGCNTRRPTPRHVGAASPHHLRVAEKK
jgi:hypothetical protein